MTRVAKSCILGGNIEGGRDCIEASFENFVVNSQNEGGM